MTTSPSTPSNETRLANAQAVESTMNNATVLRYPFQSIDLGWLVDYIGACFQPEDRFPAALRLLNDFMAFAVLHKDPFLGEACYEFYNATAAKDEEEWPRFPKGMDSFCDIARRVFEAIRLVSKYPQWDVNSKVEALGNIKEFILDIGEPRNTPTKFSTSNAEEAMKTTLSLINGLRASLDNLEIFGALMDSLRALFFCFSPCVGVYSMFQGANANGTGTYVCCDRCPCYVKFRSTYTLFIKDIEKMKVIDCLLMMAVKEDDAFACKLVEDLLQRLDYRNPFLDKPVRRVQNGSLFAARVALFDAFRHVKAIMTGSINLHTDLPSHVASVALALHVVRREVKNMACASEQLPVLDRALTTADNIYTRLGKGSVTQHLHTLKEYIITTFAFLSEPQYHLAVHSKTPPNENGVTPKCHNPCCPGNVKEVLKCAACRTVSYCGVACQREDYKSHRPLCMEMARRKVAPTIIKTAETEVQTLKSAAFS
ncbi:MYND finger [Trypanosoma brucei equiperdum]|nr:MYND finger [Trypanosoma brucei equiperdum]